MTFISVQIETVLQRAKIKNSSAQCNSLLAGGLRVFSSRKHPGKRGVRDSQRQIKTPSNRLQAGYQDNLTSDLDEGSKLSLP